MPPQGTALFGCCLALLASGCASPADADPTDGTYSTAAPIVNGTTIPADEAFRRGILSLQAGFGFLDPKKEAALDPLPGGPCSATLVGPRWVVTARHCLWSGGDPNNATLAPKKTPPRPKEEDFEGLRPKLSAFASRITLTAGATASSVQWQKSCDVAFLNTPLGTRPDELVVPPGPARVADSKEKSLLGNKYKPSPQRCVVWLESGPLDLAYISLPAAIEYPSAEAGAVLFDRSVEVAIAEQPLPNPPDLRRLPVEVVGYGTPPTGQAVLPRTGQMEAFGSEAAVINVIERDAGYIGMKPKEKVAAPQYVFRGDSGGATFLTSGVGPAFLQLGVNSHGSASAAAGAFGVGPPSAFVSASASVATMMLRWFERPQQFRHTSTLPIILQDEFPNILDWDGDGRSDFVAVGPSSARIWLGTASGFAAPYSRPYFFADQPASNLDPARAVPASLAATDGSVAGSLVAFDGEGSMRVYRDNGTALVAGGQRSLPSQVGKDRTPDNTRVVRVTQQAHDELLLVDSSKFYVLLADAGGVFNTASPKVTALAFGSVYDDDFTLADIDGDARTDFVHRSKGDVEVLRGTGDGTFISASVTPFASPLPATQGIRFYDLNSDKRDDLLWIDREGGLGAGRRVHVRLASSEKPGSFLPERVFPLELGDAWVCQGEGASVVSGYDIGDVTGDGIPDLVHAGSFGQQTSGTAVTLVPALFVKPGRKDGSLAEMRVWRLSPDKLGGKVDFCGAFSVEKVTSTAHADVVFSSEEFLHVVASQ